MHSVGSVVPFAVRRLLKMGEMTQGKLEFAWKAAVGPAIERVTQVTLTGDGTLEVRAADATWRKELRHSQPAMLARMQELLGREAVKAMKIVARGARQS